MPAAKITKTYPEIGQVGYYPRRQRNIRLSIRDTEIRVSYPGSLGFGRAEAFVLGRKAWIMKNKDGRGGLADGCRIGRGRRLELDGRTPKPFVDGPVVRADGRNRDELEKFVKRLLKEEAGVVLPPLVEAAVARTGLRPEAVGIRYMKSQWGSCTSRKKICLNSALVYLPEELVDYVIVHELCHLKFLDHSERFWRLVETHLPDRRRLQRQLRRRRIGLTVTAPETVRRDD